MLFLCLLGAGMVNIAGQSRVPDASGDSSFETGVPTSPKYSRGRHLIYDCQGGHFACISAEEYLECRRERDEDLAKKRLRPRCAPLRAFPSERACAREQLDQIERPRPKSFCQNPDAGQTEDEEAGTLGP